MLPSILLASVASYFIGSFPTAYVLVKKFYQFDIRAAGSGNVGGRRDETTGDKRLGVAIAVIYAVKGAAAYCAAVLIFGGSFAAIAACILAVVVGHNYSVWIGFRGGRGLATAGGAMLPSFPLVVVLWGAMYILAGRFTKDVIAANKIACLCAIAIACIMAPPRLSAGAYGADGTFPAFQVFTSALLLVIFVAHFRPVRRANDKRP